MKVKLYKYRNYFIAIFTITFLLFSGYEYYYKYFDTLRNPLMIKNFIVSYGKYSIIVFIILQILQVVAFFIPGEIIQIAGGYIYGTLLGSSISFLGITIGSALVYTLSNSFGKAFVNKIIPIKDIKLFKGVSNSEKIKLIILMVYLVPGMPKDAMAYICGISNVSLKDFLIYSSTGRLPGIVISAYFGYNVTSHNWIVLILIAVSMTLLFVFGVLKGEKIIKNLTKK